MGAIALAFSVVGVMLVRMGASPIIYSDSGTVLSISRRLAEGEWTPVWDTQSPPLQDGIYAAMLGAGLNDYLHAPVLLGSFLLALLLGWIAYRVTGELVTMALPAVVLLFSPVFWIQASQLPFYPLFALLGASGLYFGIRGVMREGSTTEVLLGGVLIAASVYAFTLALIYALVPAIALVCFWRADRVPRVTLLYAAIGAAIGPWAIWHLFVGGVEHFHYHPYNWFSVKYGPMVVPEFWGNGLNLPLGEYTRVQFEVFSHAILDTWMMLLIVPGLIYVSQRFGRRAAMFGVACIALQICVLLVTKPSAHARYHYPELPLLVLLASAGLYWLGAQLAALLRPSSSLGSVSIRTGHVLLLGVVSIAIVCLVAAPPAFDDAHRHYVERAQKDKVYKDLLAMTAIMDGSRGGIIARDSAIQQLVPDKQVYTHFLLTEEEYVTYLEWPDDAAVVSVLANRGIEWVLIRNNPLRWERDYNVWLRIAYDKEPRHYLRLPESPAFDEVYSGPAYKLYRLDLEALAALSYQR